MPAKLLAVARRPDGLRDKHHVAHNIPTLKLYYLTSGRQRLHQTATKYDNPKNVTLELLGPVGGATCDIGLGPVASLVNYAMDDWFYQPCATLTELNRLYSLVQEPRQRAVFTLSWFVHYNM